MQETYEMPIQVLSDENGFFDRECPNENCLFTFKVLLTDWEEKVADEHVFCPRCGFDAPADQWWTQSQLSGLNENISSFAMGLIHDELKDYFGSAKSRLGHNKNVSITYKPGKRPQYLNLPITQSEEWATKVTCDECCVTFSVIGNAYFCPCCGKNLSTNAIGEALESYERRLASFEGLRSFYENEYSKEEAEKQIVLSREDMLDSLVGTFESFAKSRYLELGGDTPRGNVFQRISDGSNLFKSLIGIEYCDLIGENGVQQLTLLINKRHLIAHNNGIVDESYLRKTGDVTYVLGQRIVLKDSDLADLLNLVRELVHGLMNTKNFSKE